MQLEVAGQFYGLDMNVNAIFDTIRAFGYSKISALNEIFNMDDDPSIDQIEGVSYLVRAGIYEHQRGQGEEPAPPSIRDINTVLFSDQEKMQEVLENAFQNLPGENGEAEQEGGEKKGKKK